MIFTRRIRNNKMPTLPTTTKRTTKRTTTTAATTTEATTTTTKEQERSSTMSSEQMKKHREVCDVLIKVAKAANISINSTVLQNCNKNFDANTTSNSTQSPGGVETTTTPKTKPTTLKTTTTPKPKTRYWGPFRYKNLMLGTRYPYEHALHLSSMFFEAQKSGRLPRDNRIRWRGNSALRDKAEGGQSLVGECFG